MEQDTEPENIITTEGKIGYEWLLTKHLRDIERAIEIGDTMRATNLISHLYRALHPYVSDSEYEEFKKERKPRSFSCDWVEAPPHIDMKSIKRSWIEAEALYEYCIDKMYEIGLMPVEKKGERA